MMNTWGGCDWERVTLRKAGAGAMTVETIGKKVKIIINFIYIQEQRKQTHKEN